MKAKFFQAMDVALLKPRSAVLFLLLLATGPGTAVAQEAAPGRPARAPATSPDAEELPAENKAVAEPAGAAATEAKPPAGPALAPRKGPPKLPQRLDEYILAGGPLMIPIGICSFIAIIFTLERWVVLRRRRVIPRDFVVRFIQHLEQGKLDRKSALRLCEENGSPVARVFEHGVRKWGKPSVEVEQAIIDGGERQVSDLRRNLRILNAVATISPLLGLLGTVLGMIETFYQIASIPGAAKAGDFAGGIGMALITTAGGLVVAIPALVIYMYFVGRVDALVSEMDLASQKVVNLISAEGLANPPAPTVKTSVKATKPEPEEEAPKESKEKRKAV